MKLHRSINIFIAFASVVSMLFLGTSSYTDYSTPTQFHLSIINSYSGYIQRASGNAMTTSGGQQRTNQQLLAIDLTASTGSIFELNGDILTLSGDGGGHAYTTTRDTFLLSGDGSKSIQATFWRANEPYHSNSLPVALDTTPPTIPIIISPYDNTILTNIIDLTRSGSQDGGIGLSGYHVHLSLDPGFFGEIMISTSGTHLGISSNDLPQGTLFRYIEAIDFLGNASKSAPQFFHNTRSSTVAVSQSHRAGGGGSYRTTPSTIPDTTSSITTGTIISGAYHTGQTNHTRQPNISKQQSPTSDTTIIPSTGDMLYTIKQRLLSNYNTLRTTTGTRPLLTIPNQDIDQEEQHSSPTPNPDPLLYKNALKQHYYHIQPLGYALNYVSWIVTLGSLFIKKIILLLQKYKKSLKLFDK